MRWGMKNSVDSVATIEFRLFFLIIAKEFIFVDFETINQKLLGLLARGEETGDTAPRRK